MVNPLVTEGEELSDDEEELTSGWPEDNNVSTASIYATCIVL